MKNLVNQLQTIETELFYNVSLQRDKINLQGKLTEESLEYSKKLKIENLQNFGNYIKGEFNNIIIVLTF